MQDTSTQLILGYPSANPPPSSSRRQSPAVCFSRMATSARREINYSKAARLPCKGNLLDSTDPYSLFRMAYLSSLHFSGCTCSESFPLSQVPFLSFRSCLCFWFWKNRRGPTRGYLPPIPRNSLDSRLFLTHFIELLMSSPLKWHPFAS